MALAVSAMMGVRLCKVRRRGVLKGVLKGVLEGMLEGMLEGVLGVLGVPQGVPEGRAWQKMLKMSNDGI